MITPKIRILHQMARCGGTIISKCIGCMDNILLLSEIHPQNMADMIIHQAYSRHNIISEEEYQHLKNNGNFNFIKAISLIYDRCKETDKILIIRDWSHNDYTEISGMPLPKYKSVLSEVLSDTHDIINTSTVRHPIDQWLSLKTLTQIKDRISLDSFLYGYRRFAELSKDVGFIRFEDFTADPDKHLSTLSKNLDMPFDQNYINKWPDFNIISGDCSGRGAKNSKISTLPRRNIDSELLQQFENNSDYLTSLELLGYNHPSPNDKNTEIDPDDLTQAKSINKRGEELFYQGKMSDAITTFNKALEIFPGLDLVHNNLGVVYWQLNNMNMSISNFLKAIEINPDNRDTVINCGKAFEENSQVDDAIHIYQSYLNNHQDDFITDLLEKISNTSALENNTLYNINCPKCHDLLTISHQGKWSCPACMHKFEC